MQSNPLYLEVLTHLANTLFCVLYFVIILNIDIAVLQIFFVMPGSYEWIAIDCINLNLSKILICMLSNT